MTGQSYQRGVHKGNRVNPEDYSWPDGFVNPDAGLVRQAATAVRTGYTISNQRFAPLGSPVERLSHMGKTSGMATPGELGRKMEEAREFGVDPTLNPIIPIDPKIMLPRYRTARNGEWESGK